MSTELTTRRGPPEGVRILGQRVKPIIRLGMGVKDPERGFPKKTDHFTVRGDERAVAKFTEIYGATPKAVKIMVPSELGLALDISYRAFVGGGDDDGGRPLALGVTNFAPLGFVGGPDVLRVWKQDGSYEEVETLGLDELGKPLDPIAESLGIAVHTTFTFTIPEVLGWGSFAAITSKGKKSADNLAFKLGQIYSAFGSRAPWAFDKEQPPMLVLKPDSAMLRFEDKSGNAKWGKTKIFVLDIVIPEAFDDMLERLQIRSREIGDPAARMFGEPRAEIPAASVSPPETTEPLPADAAETSDDEPEEILEGDVVDDEPADEEERGGFRAPEGAGESDEVLAADDAASEIFPKGKHKEMSLREVAELGDAGVAYIRYVLQSWDESDFTRAAWAFAKVYCPDAYQFAMVKKETS